MWCEQRTLISYKSEKSGDYSIVYSSTLSMLGKNFSRRHFYFFFIFFFFHFFKENRIWYFMQIVSSGDNLHAISNPIFLKKKKKKKNHQSIICWICQKGAKNSCNSWIIKIFIATDMSVSLFEKTEIKYIDMAVYAKTFSVKKISLKLFCTFCPKINLFTSFLYQPKQEYTTVMYWKCTSHD